MASRALARTSSHHQPFSPIAESSANQATRALAATVADAAIAAKVAAASALAAKASYGQRALLLDLMGVGVDAHAAGARAVIHGDGPTTPATQNAELELTAQPLLMREPSFAFLALPNMASSADAAARCLDRGARQRLRKRAVARGPCRQSESLARRRARRSMPRFSKNKHSSMR